MQTNTFWEDRAKKYGHTGDADPFYYCFDQSARIFVINSILKKIGLSAGYIMDFGCGSGDFIPGLLKENNQVIAYEISNTLRKQLSKRFKFSSVFVAQSISDIQNYAPLAGILTVTVLQHLSGDALKQVLGIFQKSLSPEGTVICMEFFPENKQAEDEYICVSDWQNLITTYGFKITNMVQIYNPVEFPVKSWHQYQNNTFIQLIKPFKSLRPIQFILKQMACKYIRANQDIITNKQSQYRVYILRKNTA